MTLRELFWMAEAVLEERWNHTSCILAMTANVNRDPKKRSSPFKPSDFNPYAKKGAGAPPIPLGPGDFDMLKVLVTKGR